MEEKLKMRNPFDREGWYKSERDGSLEKYLETYDGFSCFPLFRGIEIYNKLLEGGYLIPNYSLIRLMWNIGREDEHFLVLENRKLEGISLTAHSGMPGIYEAKEIIKDDGPCFEAQNLRRKIS